MGLKWAEKADADEHMSLPSVVPGALVLRITGSKTIAGTGQK